MAISHGNYIDADNHFYETPDCFSRHIEAKYADKAITASPNEDGTWAVKVGQTPFTFFDPKFDKTNPPGSLLEILRAKDKSPDIKWGDSYSVDNMLPAFQQRSARLALMDEQGIQSVVMLPTFGVAVEDYMTGDPEQLYANLRSFNRWVEETWGFADGRIFSPPMLSLVDRDMAIAELDRVLAAGARIVHLRPGPIGNGMSPADPHFDPFWSRINEAKVPVAFHIADSRYPEVSKAWGEDPDPNVREMTAFQWAFVHGDRPIMETFGALIYGNMFGRFPNLRCMSIENGSDWVPYLLRVLDKKKGMGRYARWIGGRPAGRPSDTFKQHCYVSPYAEDDVSDLVDTIGASQVLFGSDYPHPEGLANPLGFEALLADRTEAEIDLIMRENAASLLGV